MKLPWLLAATFVLGCFGEIALAQEDEGDFHTVKRGFFEVVENVTATVESKSMQAVSPETENWTDLVIEEVLPEGTMVDSGQVIARFETDEIDRKLDESRQASRLGKLNRDSAALELELKNGTIDLDRQLAERTLRNAEQDYKYFTEVDRPNREKSARHSVESSEYSLEYAQEELNQLQRMYEEDELTEESEEIVLKRAQRDVENRQFYLEQTQLRASRTLGVDLPRELEQSQEKLERSRLELERTKTELPIALEKAEVDLKKSVMAFEEAVREMEDLENDRARMELAAPAAGYLYYGRCVRGQWLGVSGKNRDYEIGQSVPHDKVMLTIVSPEWHLRAALSEAQLAHISANSSGLATPTAFPKTHAGVQVADISYIPFEADKYDCTMELVGNIENLMAGMTCDVRFVIRQNEEAIAVPESAVFTDDGAQYYVYVKTEEGPHRTQVSVGLTSDEKTEILEGLLVDDIIYTKRPE
ncbi:MAG: hypothetical protein ACR2NP_02070 [Pirellulaceae bacterium]